MKKAFLFAFLFFGALCFAQQNPNAICGYWRGPKDKNGRSAVIRIFREGETFSAVAVAFTFIETDHPDFQRMLDEPLADQRNRAKALAEITKLYGMKWQRGEWRGGKIHNPVDDKDFTINIKLSRDKDIAKIRVSLDSRGIIGINTEWNRATAEEEARYEKFARDFIPYFDPQ